MKMSSEEQAQDAAGIKSSFLLINEAEIQSLAGSGSFGRGRAYFRDEHISDAILRGTILSADCEGSEEEPYDVTITLVRATDLQPDIAPTTYGLHGKKAGRIVDTGVPGIASYSCSCEASGFCKHLVALALTWIEAPETIDVRPEFATLLANHSREQLLALCIKLLQYQPDMEFLIDVVPAVSPPVTLPPDGALEPSDAGAKKEQLVSPLANTLSVDVKTIVRKVQKAFRNHNNEYDEYGDYDTGDDVAAELEPVREMGDNYAEAGQWANAHAVYATLATEIIQADENEYDTENALSEMVGDCYIGLARCFESQTTLPESARLSADARKQLLETLLEIWEHDPSVNNYVNKIEASENEANMEEYLLQRDPQAMIARNLTAEERVEVEAWVRNGMREGNSYGVQQRNRAGVDFLVALRIHSGMSDEEKIEEYRRYDLFEDMTKLLLQLGRIEDAINVAQDHLTHHVDLTNFADRLLRLGEAHTEQGLSFIERQLDEADKSGAEDTGYPFLRWLAPKYAQYNRPAQALATRRRLFDKSLGAATYRDLREAAKLPGNPDDTWPQLRPRLITILEERGLWSELVLVYVEEKETRAALDALTEYDQKSTHRYGADMHVSVAKLAEADFPNEARMIYQLLAENAIEARGRGNYQVAATYLVRAKDLWARQDRTAQWQSYITSLRDRNKRLSALQEELRALKLI